MENEFYKPIIIDNLRVSGIADGTIPPGQSGNIIVRKFTSSLSPNFSRHFNNIISLFLNQNAGNSLNNLLVIIKPDFKAYVYTKFPLSINIKASRDLKKGELVMFGDFADLDNVSFHDATIDLNPEKGDQIVWLFRDNWHFGLHFDFSRLLDRAAMLSELGYHYKKMLYLEMYSFLSTEKHFKSLINDGWFPFIRLLNGQFNNLIAYYEEDMKFNSYTEKVVDSFTDDHLRKIVARWWRNPVLNNKKEIIQSGIDAYISRTKSGFINCIKNLVTELEGIIRMACYHETGNKSPSTKQIKEYIVESGKQNFKTLATLGFTNEFMFYLNDSIFKGFDLEKDIPSSRHSVAHGVATTDSYTQMRALQIILTIDQAFYFLGNKNIA
ncbi:hypothetical protein PbJCM13498_29140 [Prolixibacter bellariivorans]|uniref:Uncharacterized protein n=1 Tax=Prolixibacter bellariivorans TaxID=314319 RepID=A0A5M4B291_9BACT|nr:hypothetical protein [Prolixibacter bellariivorans]GET34051.1 hypothetical protein PbJCM13498_29140 [Prolixibacter bellariivorans]